MASLRDNLREASDSVASLPSRKIGSGVLWPCDVCSILPKGSTV
jgi:hypothetical protein